MAAKLTRDEVARWERAGRTAYAAGIRYPLADPVVMAAIEHLPVGAGAEPIMRAWSAGWTRANLAAPID